MARLLLLLAIVIVIALLMRRLVTARRDPGPTEPPAGRPSENPEAKLVRCVECGAFVPKAGTVPVDNGFRCGAGCLPR
jgi:hypothetical protein